MTIKFYPKEKKLLKAGYIYLYSMHQHNRGRGKCFFNDDTGITVEIYTRDIIIMYPDRLWIKSNGVFMNWK